MKSFWYYYNTVFLPILNGTFLILVALTLVGPWANYQVNIGKTQYEQRCPVWMGWSLSQAGLLEAKP